MHTLPIKGSRNGAFIENGLGLFKQYNGYTGYPLPGMKFELPS